MVGQHRRMGQVVEIVYETHALTEDNETGRATGWLPGRLSATGRENARVLGERRRDDGLAAVFTSDLGRALETVGIAFDGSPIPVLHDWRLRECDYGERNGAPTSEVHGVARQHLDTPYPGGESWRQAVARVGRFLDDLPSRWTGQRVLVVGHGAHAARARPLPRRPAARGADRRRLRLAGGLGVPAPGRLKAAAASALVAVGEDLGEGGVGAEREVVGLGHPLQESSSCTRSSASRLASSSSCQVSPVALALRSTDWPLAVRCRRLTRRSLAWRRRSTRPLSSRSSTRATMRLGGMPRASPQGLLGVRARHLDDAHQPEVAGVDPVRGEGGGEPRRGEEPELGQQEPDAPGQHGLGSGSSFRHRATVTTSEV